MYKLSTRLIAELIGTFWLVLAVVGTAFLGTGAASGILAIALAIGLAVMAGAYVFGPISGGHFNPAVSIGLAVAGKFAWKDVLPYVVAQIVGGIAGAAAVYAIASGKAGFAAGTFASTGYDGSYYPLVPVITIEVLLTAVFLVVILGVTHSRAAAGFAPIAIGLALAVIHLIAIPVSGASVNPARSLASAIFGGSESLAQVWVFFVAPIVGAVIGGIVFKAVLDKVPAKA